MLCVLVNYKTSWLFVSVTLDQKFKSVVWEPPDVTYVTLRNRRSTGCKWVHSGRTRTKLTGKTPQVPGCPSISPNYRQRKKNSKVLKGTDIFTFTVFTPIYEKTTTATKTPPIRHFHHSHTMFATLPSIGQTSREIRSNFRGKQIRNEEVRKIKTFSFI